MYYKYAAVQKPPNELTVKDLLDLRVVNGHDEFTSMSFADLKKAVKDYDWYDKYIKPLSMKSDKASVIRWVYRGLTPEQATIKVLLHKSIYSQKGV